ncbi:protein kinase domain-containing protein [Amycolatopsis pittospori]|uniref:protein kinase domain-containing protein n=1 Tax=Amycolatopsis pittospori TaxID=2749434 RepID=UPI0015F0E7DC|nr:protein kinase [Amycolatopsis pittospori]
MEGELAGRYRLGESLGRGSVGEVFAATGPDGEDYAIKLLPFGRTRDPALVERFLRAQSQLVGLRHDNLVLLHDVVIEDDAIALIQDRVPGGSLKRWLGTAGTLLPAEIARIGAGIASALHEVHALGIVHGDVRPANVLMDDSGSVRVPRLADTACSSLTQRTSGQTSLLAASTYAAPEAEDAPPSDMYSLGALLYELYCGVTPFAAGFVRAVDEGPGRPGQLPEPLWDLIRLLLAFDPSFRPTADRTAAVLRAMTPDLLGAPVGQRLERAPKPESAKDRQDTLPPSFMIGDQMYGEQLYSPPPKRKRKWVPIAVATTVVAAGAITTVALTGNSRTPVEPAAAPVPTTTVQVTATAPATEAPSGTAQAGSASVSAPPSSPALPAERYLGELEPVRGQFDSDHQTGSVAGKTYLHTVATRIYECNDPGSVEYNLSKGFRRLVASAGLDDNSPDSSLKVQLEIFGDDRKLLSTTTVLGKMVPVDVDLTGVLRLKIGWQPVKSGECGGSGNYLDLGEAKLLGLPEEVPPPTTTS